MEEQQLIPLLKKGDQEAFRMVVETYQQRVFRTCMGFVHDTQDAEDISQEVFIEMYRKIENFRQEASLSTWLYRIAVNKSLNFIRDSRKGTFWSRLEEWFSQGEKSSPAADPQPDHLMEQKDTEAAIHKALSRLPENQRVAFTLHKYEDMPYKEISKVMGVSLSSVESLIFRARKNLQKSMAVFLKN